MSESSGTGRRPELREAFPARRRGWLLWAGAVVGIGLSATAERLQILYGAEHRFEAGKRSGGGFRVAIRLPFREAGVTAA